jgi:signal transduction histidine kinase
LKQQGQDEDGARTLPGHSLRWRLAVAGLVLLGTTFVIAFLGLSLLFERHVERRVASELELHLEQIIASLQLGPDGKLALMRDPVDPRFNNPLSGLYWQIESGGETMRSRSLWDSELQLSPLEPGAKAVRQLDGPGDGRLLAVVREVIGGSRLGNKPILAAVALDRTDIDAATADFRQDMIPYFIVFALLLLIANFTQIKVGLQPLSALRDKIADIRNGRARRMGSAFPREIQPLTNEVDGLLASREEQLKRARQQAADLAHGLKTPLQALAGDVEKLKARGEAGIAADIALSITAMRRHIDHQLARTRIADRSQTKTTGILPVVNRVLAVIERTPSGERLDWNIDIEAHAAARIDAEDLAELLGNLLENAARYAESVVSIEARSSGETVLLTIADDGPGIPEDRLPDVLERGGRLDRSSNGAGLGLAIVSDIVAAAGGDFQIANGAPGLRITIGLAGA